MTNVWRSIAVLTLSTMALTCSKNATARKTAPWHIGTPITTYYAGPALSDTSATQLATGGFNLVWADEGQMEIAHTHGLRVLLTDSLLVPATMDDAAKVAKLDALIERVKNRPAMYAYYIIDEPSATLFPALGKLVAHLRAQDPAHLAYINLFPTYASNDQLGTKGDTVTAYKEYLHQFSEIVKPEMLSYDHYHFRVDGDSEQYFLNLGMIRQQALDTGVPFLNIVQACTWDPGMRAPNAEEMRWLNYTSLAYGAQGLSYFVYSYTPFYDQFKEKAGQMMRPDGTTTPQYEAARQLNPQFVAIATELQPLRSLAAYHIGKIYQGATALPDKAPFHLDFTTKGNSDLPAEGMLLGYFGKGGLTAKPTHVLVVNLNYHNAVTTTVVGPGPLSVFDTDQHKWKKVGTSQTSLTLPPGGGVLVRIR